MKLAALVVGGTAIMLFAGAPAWLFHLAVPVSVLAAVEEIAITFVRTEHVFTRAKYAKTVIGKSISIW